MSKEDEVQFSSPAYSYVNHKVTLRKIPFGIGMFANEIIKKDEVIIGWSGKVVHLREVLLLPPEDRVYILQIDEDLFQVPFWDGYGEKANYTNHSCDPNAGFGSSPISLVAMRDVQVGEEITFDYAMSECIENMEGNDGWNCECGKPNCRGAFLGSDWKRPELWERYGAYFSPYLRRKIAVYKAQLDGLASPCDNTGKVLEMYEGVAPLTVIAHQEAKLIAERNAALAV